MVPPCAHPFKLLKHYHCTLSYLCKVSHAWLASPSVQMEKLSPVLLECGWGCCFPPVFLEKTTSREVKLLLKVCACVCVCEMGEFSASAEDGEGGCFREA